MEGLEKLFNVSFGNIWPRPLFALNSLRTRNLLLCTCLKSEMLYPKIYLVLYAWSLVQIQIEYVLNDGILLPLMQEGIEQTLFSQLAKVLVTLGIISNLVITMIEDNRFRLFKMCKISHSWLAWSLLFTYVALVSACQFILYLDIIIKSLCLSQRVLWHFLPPPSTCWLPVLGLALCFKACVKPKLETRLVSLGSL